MSSFILLSAWANGTKRQLGVECLYNIIFLWFHNFENNYSESESSHPICYQSEITFVTYGFRVANSEFQYSISKMKIIIGEYIYHDIGEYIYHDFGNNYK